MENPKIKIVDVVNLIPIEIKCEIDGVLRSIKGYINYADYTVDITVYSEDLSPEIIQDLKQLVATHLQETQLIVDTTVPEAVYEQIKRGASHSSDQFLDPELSVQLKERL